MTERTAFSRKVAAGFYGNENAVLISRMVTYQRRDDNRAITAGFTRAVLRNDSPVRQTRRRKGETVKVEIVTSETANMVQGMTGEMPIVLASHGEFFISVWDGAVGRVVFSHAERDICVVEMDGTGLRVLAPADLASEERNDG